MLPPVCGWLLLLTSSKWFVHTKVRNNLVDRLPFDLLSNELYSKLLALELGGKS